MVEQLEKIKEAKIQCPISDNMLYFTVSKQYPQPHVLIGIGTPEVRPTRGFVVTVETMKQMLAMITPEILTVAPENQVENDIVEEIDEEISDSDIETVEIKPIRRVAEIRDARVKYEEPKQKFRDSRVKKTLTKNLQVVKQEAPSKPKPSPEQQPTVAAKKLKVAAAPAPKPIIQKKLNQPQIDQWSDVETDDSVDFPDPPLGDPEYEGEFEE